MSVAHVTRPNAFAQSLGIAIGCVEMNLRLDTEQLHGAIAKRYAAFTSGSKQPVEIQVTSDDASVLTPAEFECDFDAARLQARASGVRFSGVKNEYAMDSLLRMFLSWELLSRTGFLLHAATVVRDGRAYVFTGRSGAGKSTVASLSPAGSVLTDEISLLRKESGEWRAYGTPFWGEFRAAGSNTSAPVAGIFQLVQAKVNEAKGLPKLEFLRVLLTNILFFSKAAKDHNRLLEIAAVAAGEIPGHVLRFQKARKFWEAVPQ